MNGMDFFKSCGTNVRVVQDLFRTNYSLYKSSANDNLQSAVSDLRQHHVLCARAKEELWVFGPLQPELKRLLETERYSFSIHDGTDIADEPSKRAGDERLVQDILLEAIEASITYTLASEQDQRLVHLGLWTWLATSAGSHDEADQEDERGSILIKLHRNLTDAGTLYISTTTHASYLHHVRDAVASPGADILLAPSGRRAKLISSEKGQEAKGIIASSTWKRKVREAVMSESIILDLSNDAYVVVELLDDASMDRFLWPTRLCFATGPNINPEMFSSPEAPTWKQWFGGLDNSHSTFKNPLAIAEEWAVNAAEREKAAAVAAEISAEEAAAAHGVPASTTIVYETPLATSSPFNQRTIDQQVALSGIYPTPPDGLISGHVTQQSTSDGPMHTEHSGLSHELQLTSSNDSQAFSTEPQNYQPHSDDLFGDMGEMEFDANEVGDADFDYFDEPDDLPDAVGTETGARLDVEMAEASEQTMNHEMVSERQHERILSREAASIELHALLADSHPTLNLDTIQEAARPDAAKTGPAAASEHGNVLDSTSQKAQEKPLSPFSIRERILPPPIPASAITTETPQPLHHRPSSTFDPVTFRDGFDLSAKYSANEYIPSTPNGDSNPDISLPPMRKKKRPRPPPDPDSGVTDIETSSEEDSYESSTSLSDVEDLPPRLPWDTKKRKRSASHNQLAHFKCGLDDMWPDEDMANNTGEELDEVKMREILDSLLNCNHAAMTNLADYCSRAATSVFTTTSETLLVPPIDELLELNPLDLVYLAQIVSEQAISTIPGLVNSIRNLAPLEDETTPAAAAAIQCLVEDTLANIIPEAENCALANLALVREPPARPTMNPGKAPQSSYPRPLQREGSMQLGPDYFPIPPPYIRIQRGVDTWEMLPPALSFWSALGLGPANGAKDVRAISVVPGNEDLMGLVQDFVGELGRAYESLKLGSAKSTHEFEDQLNELESYKDGVVLVGVDEDDFSLTTAITAYLAACEQLGEALARVGHLDPDRTIVVYLVDPFESQRTRQYLCGCFWQLCKTYRQNTPMEYQKAPRSDLVLQILPVSLIASPDRLVVVDARQMGALATEVYDRCPPSSKAASAMDLGSALPVLAAPAVELVGNGPKRLGFQLSAEPPSDLLHEGSILHLAYAINKDGQWITVYWMDRTGRYQMTYSACLRGKSFAGVAEEIWERTLEIIMARDVIWRLFIVSIEEADASIQQCWRDLAASKPRRQFLQVTLLSVQTKPTLQLITPPPSEAPTLIANLAGQGGGYLTPGSTPQGTNMTVSPDPSGQNNNAPPTPAPSETAASMKENDSDAHLIDLTDESWGMLLAPSFSITSTSTALAKGLLCKRGDLNSPRSDGRLESMGVSLYWDIRIVPNGLVNEGQIKQAETTLREVLRMYRNLSLLSKLRHLSDEGDGEDPGAGLMPMHVECAVKGAEALNGFLD